MNFHRFTLIDLGALVTLSTIGLGVVIQPGIPPQYQDDFKKGHDASAGLSDEMRAKAFQSNCTANLKMLGTAGAIYGVDNAGNLPGPDPLKWKKGDGPGWDEVLAISAAGAVITSKEMAGDQTYAKKHQAAKTLALFAFPGDSAVKTSESLIRSYGLNLGSANMVANVNDGIGVNDDKIPISKVKSAAGTINLLEYPIGSNFGVRKGNYSIGFTGGTSKLTEVTAWMATAKNHGSTPARVNALMYDGHVEVLAAAHLTANGNQVMKYIK